MYFRSYVYEGSIKSKIGCKSKSRIAKLQWNLVKRKFVSNDGLYDSRRDSLYIPAYEILVVLGLMTSL